MASGELITFRNHCRKMARTAPATERELWIMLADEVDHYRQIAADLAPEDLDRAPTEDDVPLVT